MFAIDEVRDHAALNRPRAVKSVQRTQILDAIGLIAAQDVLHARRFELEHAARQAIAEDLLVRLGVVERQIFDDDLLAAVLFDQLECVVNDRERGQAEKVHLEKPSFSRPSMSYCVTISCLFVTYSGTSSLSGTEEMTTPAACTPALRPRLPASC